jgi:hypothetical protein
MSNPCLDAAIAALKEAGVYDYRLAPGGKHLQLHWEVNGAARFYALPNTPSDWRSSHNVRAEVRRMLKADGALVDTPNEPKPRRLSLEQRVQRLEQLAGLRGNDLLASHSQLADHLFVGPDRRRRRLRHDVRLA